MEQQEQTPTNSKTKKFLKGTMILTISSIVVKVIGALNWVILSRVMGGEGIGLYQMGFPIYLMAITVSSAGIPVAISIVTAEKVAKKDYGGAQHVFKVSLWMMLATGLLFTGALLGLAHFLVESGFIPDPRAYYSIIALAPAVFFVTFLSSFRGYFQGWQIMTPTACSEITEQLIRVVTMIAFSYLLLPYGLTYAAAGASMGAGAGAFCGLLVLLGFYGFSKLSKLIRALDRFQIVPQGEENVPPQEPEPAGEIIKRLIMLALPVSMASLMLPIVSNLDMVIVPRRLVHVGSHHPVRLPDRYGRAAGEYVHHFDGCPFHQPGACHQRIPYPGGYGGNPGESGSGLFRGGCDHHSLQHRSPCAGGTGGGPDL